MWPGLLVRSWTAPLTLAVRRPDGRDLLGHVDADRAPGDAAPATDTARDIELVKPGGELVGEPLPVAAPDARPEVTAMYPGELGIEAAIPPADALRVFQAQVSDVFHAGAKAGWTDERAVGAGQA